MEEMQHDREKKVKQNYIVWAYVIYITKYIEGDKEYIINKW